MTPKQAAEYRDAMARMRLANEKQPPVTRRKRNDAVKPLYLAAALTSPRERDPILDLPAAQAVIRRLGEATPPMQGRLEHVERLAAAVLRAKRAPNNPWAEATL